MVDVGDQYARMLICAGRILSRADVGTGAGRNGAVLRRACRRARQGGAAGRERDQLVCLAGRTRSGRRGSAGRGRSHPAAAAPTRSCHRVAARLRASAERCGDCARPHAARPAAAARRAARGDDPRRGAVDPSAHSDNPRCPVAPSDGRARRPPGRCRDRADQGRRRRHPGTSADSGRPVARHRRGRGRGGRDHPGGRRCPRRPARSSGRRISAHSGHPRAPQGSGHRPGRAG